jgi:hypothetical protein
LAGGFIFFQSGSTNKEDSCYFKQESILSIQYALFFTTISVVITSALSAVLAFAFELPIYYRDHNASVYRSDAYYLAKFISEVFS